MKKLGLKLSLLVASASLIAFAGGNSPTTGTNTWSIDGVNGPTLTYASNVATIYATFPSVQISAGATIAIPKMPNSTFEVAPNAAGGGLLLQATISAVDVANLLKLNVLPPTELPGGRPLPGIAGGTMPGVAVQVPALDNITLYIGSNLFGIFVPVSIKDDQVTGTFSYYDQSNNLMGNISIVGNDASNKNGGFLLLIDVPSAAGVMMNQGKLDISKLL